MTSIKGGCQSCKLFQHSLAPHAFCLTGKIWNASSELVLISPFPALLPLVPNAARDQAGSGRSGFFCLVRRQKDTPSGWLGYFRAPLSDHLCWGSMKPYKVTSSCLWDSELGLGGQASQADPGHFLFSLCVSLPFFFVLHSPSSHGLLFTLKITDFKNASVAVNFVCIWFYGFVELLELN